MGTGLSAMFTNTSGAGKTRPLLGTIRAVTYVVPDLSQIEAAYVTLLGYQVIERAGVAEAQALAWGAPAVAGRPVLILGPASGERVFLRFIEGAEAAGWTALMTFGWNATEFVVQNVDSLAERLATGPFEIVGPPKGLTRFPMIRAMQALGPAGECCYFTQVGEGSGLELAAARSFVGRVFIVVAAGPDADALFEPYARFGNKQDAPVATAVQVISRAHGLPPETLHRHGLVRLPQGTLVELDQYPASANSRRMCAGALAVGMSIVTFEVPSLAGYPLLAATARCGLPGMAGEAGCLRGVTGELIELIELSAG